MVETTAIKSISAKEMTRKVINHQPLFILDVRNESDFDDWKIEGEDVHIIRYNSNFL